MAATKTESLNEFLDKWCERSATAKALRTRLFEAYEVFCLLERKHCVTPDRFVTSLKELGLRFEENDVLGIDLSNDFTDWALQAAQEHEVRNVRRRDG